MRIESSALKTPDFLNPKGGIAKDLEMTAKRASWLSLMCAHWLSYKDDDALAARRDEPSYNLPNFFRDSERFNLARKKSGVYEKHKTSLPTYKYKISRSGEGKWVRGNSTLDNQYTIPVPQLRWAERWDWGWVFDYWYSGGLDEAVKNLMEMLPPENVEAIEKELLK